MDAIQRLNVTKVAGWTVFMRAMVQFVATITAEKPGAFNSQRLAPWTPT